MGQGDIYIFDICTVQILCLSCLKLLSLVHECNTELLCGQRVGRRHTYNVVHITHVIHLYVNCSCCPGSSFSHIRATLFGSCSACLSKQLSAGKTLSFHCLRVHRAIPVNKCTPLLMTSIMKEPLGHICYPRTWFIAPPRTWFVYAPRTAKHTHHPPGHDV